MRTGPKKSTKNKKTKKPGYVDIKQWLLLQRLVAVLSEMDTIITDEKKRNIKMPLYNFY